MKKNICLLSIFTCIIFANCKKEFGINENIDGNALSQIAYAKKNSNELTIVNFTNQDIFPEGLAYDPVRNWFYVSSATVGTVGIVTMDGSYTPFISDDILTGTTGLKVDQARRRLWVSNAESGIGAYDLSSGHRLFFTDLTLLLPGEPVFINDLALDPQGNAYITNSFSPVIYKVDKNGNASVFFQNDAFATGPEEFGFTGIQYDERGFLLVAFADQIIKIPVRNPSAYSIVQLNVPVYPDGLLLSKDGKQLVIVHNTGGTEDDKVYSFLSDDKWISGTLSTSFNTGAVFPTSASSDSKKVYVLYSYIHKLISGESHNTYTIQEVPLQKQSPF
ncbi:MAG: hypothetical protein ACR2KB_08025 [Chitinophagaceae bacterium]